MKATSKTCKRARTRPKKATIWDEAISDAQAQIEKANQRIASLRDAIATFQGLRDTGAIFPGYPKVLS